jgi:catechol-2,3-dioxygenase
VSGFFRQGEAQSLGALHNDALDTNFENFVDVVGFFDRTNTDTLEYVFDINGNGIQVS